MHTDKLFVVFGSDSRFEYTREALKKSGHNTVDFREILKSDFSSLRDREKALVLGLPFSRDLKSINLPELDYAITLSGVLSSLESGDLVFGGMLSNSFKEKVAGKSAVCFDYYDEELILQNAELTAISLLRFMEDEGIDATASKFALTGFGRTAKAISEAFSRNGYDFTVVARSDSAESDAKSMNFKFVKLESFTEKLHIFDVIINTVPALIFDAQRLSAIKRGAPIIDIASAPFGVEKSDADEYGIRLIRAPGLPGRYMPEEAGTLIAERIEYYLKGGR